MATNFTIENMGRIIESGDTGAFMGRSQAVTDSMVTREMQKNGMQIPNEGTSASSDNAKTFAGMLEQSLDKVNQYQHQADTAVKELISGRSKNIHETMLTLERADTSLKLAMQVRNKILEAYREVMRMQV